uniref:Uncharacterized protein n=1 Tax=Anguilla anguilla TaxID=7936 RepID=A0A0E9UM62_ANGAN
MIQATKLLLLLSLDNFRQPLDNHTTV